MSTVPSPAELYWRIGWLTGTATPPPPQPEPGPAPEPRQPVTLRSAVRRSILEQSIRVQVDAERQIAAVFAVPPAQVGRRPRRLPAEVQPLVGDYPPDGYPHDRSGFHNRRDEAVRHAV